MPTTEKTRLYFSECVVIMQLYIKLWSKNMHFWIFRHYFRFINYRYRQTNIQRHGLCKKALVCVCHVCILLLGKINVKLSKNGFIFVFADDFNRTPEWNSNITSINNPQRYFYSKYYINVCGVLSVRKHNRWELDSEHIDLINSQLSKR